MSIEVTSRIEIGLQVDGKTSRYPVTAYLSLAPEKEDEFEQFKRDLENETKEMEELTLKGKRLSREIMRIQEDIDDIDDEMSDADSEARRSLRKKRKKLRKELRALEDELEAHNRVHDVAYYQKSLNDMVEKIAKKSFELNINDDDQRRALEKAIEKYGIRYGVVVAEIGRLIEEAKKKKKKRSSRMQSS